MPARHARFVQQVGRVNSHTYRGRVSSSWLERTTLEARVHEYLVSYRSAACARRLGSSLLGLVRDPRTPVGHKLFLAGLLALILSPINWIPSFIPILGQMEDLALLALALRLFLKRVPAELKHEHEAALGMPGA